MTDLVDAPIVAVDGRQVLVDGVLAGTTRDVEAFGRVETLSPLLAMLRAKRDLWRAVQPGRPHPGTCILQIDVATEALVVKSVFQTAAAAGFPHVSFLVRRDP